MLAPQGLFVLYSTQPQLYAATGEEPVPMKVSLSMKLNLMIALSTLILLIGLSYAYLSIFTQGINEQTYEYARDNLNDVTTMLEDHISDLMVGAELMTTVTDICQFLTDDVNVRLETASSVQSQLAAYVNYKQGVSQMYLRSRSGTRLRSSAEKPEAYTTEFFQLYLSIQEEYDLSVPFRRVQVTHTYLTQSGQRYFALLIPVFRPVAAPRDSDFLGSLIAICDLDILPALVPDSLTDRLLIYEGDTLLYGENTAFHHVWGNEGQTDMVNLSGEDRPVLTAGMTGAPWTLHLLVISESMDERITQVGRLCLIIAVLIVIVQCMLLSLSHRSFVQPVLNIVRQMQKIGSLSARISAPKGAQGEMITLVDEANNMLQRTEQLQEEMTETRLRYYRERIIFLQTQINPHFLYNNLQCIRGMAASGCAREIREMASCIASIYRYGARDSAVATLQEEMGCLMDYCRIMNLRYADRFLVTREYNEEALNCRLPRMTLQPLVENSFKHGFGMTGTEGGSVDVSAREENGRLIVLIQDTGRGMDEATLETVNHSRIVESEPIHHLGIANVRTRLELLFGPDSTLTFASSSQGTTVTITVDQNPKK